MEDRLQRAFEVRRVGDEVTVRVGHQMTDPQIYRLYVNSADTELPS